MDLLHRHFLPLDVDVITSIRPVPRVLEDTLAWAPEKSGNFTVRSAYRMAMDERERPLACATSRAPDGRRTIWKIILGCPAPPKVRLFAWRLVSNSLPTWSNKFSRGLESSYMCPLCGVEREDIFHAFCRCPRAVALWQAMTSVWPLPDIRSIRNTGPEWLLGVLEPLSETVRMVLLMTLWRTWHVHNEITHDKEAPPTEASKRFLLGYINSLLCIQHFPSADMEKGKMVLPSPAARDSVDTSKRIKEAVEQLRWARPPPGWAKLNTDGSFVAADGSAGAGMVLRDASGAIIFTACRGLLTCDNALQAKLEACREGLDLALQWTPLPVLIEMDCAEAVTMIQDNERNRSRYMTLVHEIKALMADQREVVITLASRSQNKVSHGLAAYGRSTPRTAIWLGSGMEEVVSLCKNDIGPP